jgi:hypothetical protein
MPAKRGRCSFILRRLHPPKPSQAAARYLRATENTAPRALPEQQEFLHAARGSKGLPCPEEP